MKLTFSLKKSPDFIFDCLTDIDKFTSVHPVITRIESLGGDRFFVHEKLRLGIIPYSFTYPVIIASDRDGMTVTYKATIMNMTHIVMHFSILEENGQSLVEEDISIRTILPVKGLIRKVFKEQHTILFKNIDNLPDSE